MPFPTRQFICIVDGYRRPSRQRNTWGRYRVGARSAKEARKILQKRIGFGSVQVYYEDTNPVHILKRGDAVKETFIGNGYTLVPVRHALSSQKAKETQL